jgi:hypothetical protein
MQRDRAESPVFPRFRSGTVDAEPVVVIATVHPLPVIRTSGPERTRARTVTGALGLVLGAAILVGGIVHAAGSEARAVRELPTATRSALYARALENLASVCGDPRSTTLPEFCHAQARLALAFPECDGACVELARASLRQPTR